MKVRIEIDVNVNLSRILYNRLIFFKHLGANYQIDKNQVIAAVRKKLDALDKIKLVASQIGVDPEELMNPMEEMSK